MKDDDERIDIRLSSLCFCLISNLGSSFKANTKSVHTFNGRTNRPTTDGRKQLLIFC